MEDNFCVSYSTVMIFKCAALSQYIQISIQVNIVEINEKTILYVMILDLYGKTVQRQRKFPFCFVRNLDIPVQCCRDGFFFVSCHLRENP